MYALIHELAVSQPSVIVENQMTFLSVENYKYCIHCKMTFLVCEVYLLWKHLSVHFDRCTQIAQISVTQFSGQIRLLFIIPLEKISLNDLDLYRANPAVMRCLLNGLIRSISTIKSPLFLRQARVIIKPNPSGT